MAELVSGGLFVAGFPPENGDHIGLEIEGEVSEFFVHLVRGNFHCEEVRGANPRHLQPSEEELTLHYLEKVEFYQMMAGDMGLLGRPVEIVPGIWEIGKKRFPGKDASKVMFVEQGVPDEVLELTVMRDPFNAICLLAHGTMPQHDWHSDKTLVAGVIEVRKERFASEVFDDLSASQREASTNTWIDLYAQPPKLWICGEEFSLPISSQGRPTDGCRYLAHLFDHSENPITCWDLYLEIRPEKKEKIGEPFWSEDVLSKRALSEIKARLKEAQAELTEAELDPSTPESELEKMRKNLEQLQAQASKLLNKSGKSRQIVEGDHGKARQRVRKALKLVIEKVKDQSVATGTVLEDALGGGDLVMFRPPDEWGL